MTLAKCQICNGVASASTFEEAKLLIDHSVPKYSGNQCDGDLANVIEIKNDYGPLYITPTPGRSNTELTEMPNTNPPESHQKIDDSPPKKIPKPSKSKKVKPTKTKKSKKER